jgi:DNA-binding transcriptional ArsR family regulator
MKALADESRLRVVLALRRRELCLCQVVELLGLASSTVSRHMSILHHARIVESRKDGRWTYFRLADESESPQAAAAAALITQSLVRDDKIRRDEKRLRQILKMDPEALCRRQCEGKC